MCCSPGVLTHNAHNLQQARLKFNPFARPGERILTNANLCISTNAVRTARRSEALQPDTFVAVDTALAQTRGRPSRLAHKTGKARSLSTFSCNAMEGCKEGGKKRGKKHVHKGLITAVTFYLMAH